MTFHLTLFLTAILSTLCMFWAIYKDAPWMVAFFSIIAMLSAIYVNH
jgi:hypothetical protein